MSCHISHLSNIMVRLTLNKSKYPRTIHMSSHICHLRTGPCCGIAKTGVEAWQSVSAQCPVVMSQYYYQDWYLSALFSTVSILHCSEPLLLLGLLLRYASLNHSPTHWLHVRAPRQTHVQSSKLQKGHHNGCQKRHTICALVYQSKNSLGTEIPKMNRN